MRVLGVDPSLTSTGLAWNNPPGPDYRGDEFPGWHTARLRQRNVTGHERLETIVLSILSRAHGCDLVTIEGLAFAAKGNALLDLAGLHQLIRHGLWQQGTPYAVVPPAQLKMYATGSGAAGKDEVLLAVARRWAPVAVPAGNDDADALVLASMAADHLGQPPLELPATHRRALAPAAPGKKGIEWPALSG